MTQRDFEGVFVIRDKDRRVLRAFMDLDSLRNYYEPLRKAVWGPEFIPLRNVADFVNNEICKGELTCSS